MPVLFTIGHSTREPEAFVALLQEHGVRFLADVRRFPGSRRNPAYGSEPLRERLDAAGIGYRHVEPLGGRRAALADSPNGYWRNASFRGYADHMASPAFRAALEALLEDAAVRPTAVMCAEAVPWRCHRNLIADAVALADGWEVRHIVGPGRAEAHRPNAAAERLPDGTLRYPGSQGSLFG